MNVQRRAVRGYADPRSVGPYMSGYAHSVLTSQGTLEAGVTLIEKPFTEAALLGKVREVLDGG